MGIEPTYAGITIRCVNRFAMSTIRTTQSSRADLNSQEQLKPMIHTFLLKVSIKEEPRNQTRLIILSDCKSQSV